MPAMMGRSRNILTWDGAGIVILALLLVGISAPVLHDHQASAPGFYDEECPTARLATTARHVGLSSRPPPTLGIPLPVLGAPIALPPPAVPERHPSIVLARAPPRTA